MGISIYEPAPIPGNERQREQAVEQSGIMSLSGDATLQALIKEARHALRAPMAAITVVYRDWQYIIAADGFPLGPYSRRTSMCGHAIHHPRHLFLVKDARRDARFCSNPAMEENGLLFYVGAPLVGDDGLPLGVLCVVDTHARQAFTDVEGAALRSLADRTMEYVRAR